MKGEVCTVTKRAWAVKLITATCGVDDICIKLQVTYNGERKIKSAKRRTYDFI